MAGGREAPDRGERPAFRYQVPQGLWEKAPQGREVYWRAFALPVTEGAAGGARYEVGQGVVALA